MQCLLFVPIATATVTATIRTALSLSFHSGEAKPGLTDLASTEKYIKRIEMRTEIRREEEPITTRFRHHLA